MILKKEGKDYFSKDCYLYTPTNNPGTWALRYKERKGNRFSVTRFQLFSAAAALSPVADKFRPLNIPSAIKEGLKRRLHSLFRSINVSEDEIPDYIKTTVRENAEVTKDRYVDIQEGISVFDETATAEKFDWQKGVLRNIAMVGPISENNRRYRIDTLKGAVSKGLYEGRPAYLNHTKSETGRDVRDLVGEWRNVRWDEITNRVRGDLYAMKQHRELLKDIVENVPNQVAPSHVIRGASRKVKTESGFLDEVTLIDKVYSVDLVVGAATIKSIKEGLEMDYSKISLDELKEKRPDIFEQIRMMEAGNAVDVDVLKKKMEEISKEKEKIEKELREAKERAETEKRIAETRENVRKALEESALPDSVKKILESRLDGQILSESEIKKIIESQAEIIEKATGKKLEHTKENKTDLPDDNNGGGADDIQKEAVNVFLRLGGIKIDEKKEKE